jgi:hypothetical protein
MSDLTTLFGKNNNGGDDNQPKSVARILAAALKRGWRNLSSRFRGDSNPVANGIPVETAPGLASLSHRMFGDLGPGFFISRKPKYRPDTPKVRNITDGPGWRFRERPVELESLPATLSSNIVHEGEAPPGPAPRSGKVVVMPVKTSPPKTPPEHPGYTPGAIVRQGQIISIHRVEWNAGGHSPGGEFKSTGTEHTRGPY